MQPPSSPRKPTGSKDASERDDDALVKPAATSKPKSSTKSSTTKATGASGTRASTTKPAPKPSAAAAPSSPTPAASAPPASSEPDIFKPLPPRAAAPKASSTSATGKPQGADRVVHLGRTLATRNLEIARRWGASAGSAARNQAAKINKRVSSVDVNKPLNRFTQSTGKFVQRSGTMLDESTGKLQKQLETSDAAVVILTLVLVAARRLLTAFVVPLSVRR